MLKRNKSDFIKINPRLIMIIVGCSLEVFPGRLIYPLILVAAPRKTVTIRLSLIVETSPYIFASIS